MIDYQLQAKHWLMLVLLGLTMLLASINPMEFSAYVLHQVGTVIMLIVLLLLFKKVGLSFSSFVFYLIFLLIHILGAHYLYSYVPYNDWLLQYFGFDLNQWLGWERNMYDRCVHFAYGVLLYPLFFRLHRLCFPKAKDLVIFLLVVQWVMSSSLIYEWLEWLLAVTLSPEAAENYNGQQGDVWDAHKDMLLATLGAILAGSWNLYKDRKKALD
ncbi:MULTISPECIES: DUF2238 domain-containing protein [Acinetobacter]|uniref:DUF2238 domain-containing protein n=1 Tax=Acinetobacter TaxID=469 RepID=UPI0025759B02|nr:DUF2238 domain-containing protein [Acinetobacter indicus]MDM1770390.1 DUF2238 domain-containing protein [Acinetobacter indicus]MDM1773188.1 DUF2238 domain-containing protein [Acinetobacter indicus]